MSNYKKVCDQCGAELYHEAKKCYHCGHVLEFSRNGFITFWLWLGVVGSVISLGSTVVIGTDIADVAGYVFFSLVSSLVGCVGYVMLLLWNRGGFVVTIVASVMNLVGSIIASTRLEEYLSYDYYYDEAVMVGVTGMSTYAAIIGAVVGAVILFAILQIKSDGVSYWDAMKLREERESGSAPAERLYNSNKPAPAPALAPEPVEVTPPQLTKTAKYWVALNGAKSGPFTIEQMEQMMLDGQIDASSLVWTQGMAQWAVAESVPELESLLAQTPPPMPTL